MSFKHAHIGTAGRRAARIPARPAAGAGAPQDRRQRRSAHEVPAAVLPAGPILVVPPADLHDAPLQELQGELLQAFGYYGAGRGAPGGHGEERGCQR